ncbi:MAG: TlpA family protein disulfide reductase, partial [Halobacteria archaeon]|nr:TlpA family protein disulfide reductase [Halobacteria archaeon]
MLLRKFCFLTLCLALPVSLVAQQSSSIDSKGATLTADVYPAKGTMLYLWLPPEGGFQPAHSRIAQALNSLGIEVWLADLFEGRFLPPVASSLEQIPATDVSVLLSRAQQTGKHIILVSSGRGTFPL